MKIEIEPRLMLGLRLGDGDRNLTAKAGAKIGTKTQTTVVTISTVATTLTQMLEP